MEKFYIRQTTCKIQGFQKNSLECVMAGRWLNKLLLSSLTAGSLACHLFIVNKKNYPKPLLIIQALTSISKTFFEHFNQIQIAPTIPSQLNFMIQKIKQNRVGDQ